MMTAAANSNRRVARAIVTALTLQDEQPNHALAERARLAEHEAARLRDQLKAAQERIAALEKENDRLAARNMIANSKARAGVLVDPSTNAPVGTQVDYAIKWNQEQSTISRWVAAGKLLTVHIGRRRMVYLDQLPPAKKR
jgi:hypothetical protein